MSIESAAIENLNLNSFELSPLDKSVISVLDQLVAKLKTYGFNTQATSPNSMAKFMTLPSEVKLEIKNYYQNRLDLISSADVLDLEFETEKKLLKKTFLKEGLEAPEDFWSKLESNQYIQVFNDKMNLTYCSLNFFAVSSYSFLDFAVFEWYILWERPKLIIEMMHKYATEVFTGPYKCADVLIPKHIVREIYDTGNTSPFIPHAALMRFHQMIPLQKEGGSRICAFAVTSSAERIAEGEEAKEIHFV